MGKLFDTIRQLVDNESYVIGQHALERLEERGILEWQAVAALNDGTLLIERPQAVQILQWRCWSSFPTEQNSKRYGLT